MTKKKLDAATLNPFAPRKHGEGDDDASADDGSSQTQTLLGRASKSGPSAVSPSKARHRAASSSALRGYLLVLVAFAIGLSLGFAAYSRIDSGMIDIRDAVSAARQAKRNAAMLSQGVAADRSDSVITRVAKDALQLHIMTFNLRYGAAQDGANSWKYRRAHAADVVNRYVPVVFGTQEGMAEQLADLHALLARPYERFGEPREANGEHVQIFYDTSLVERLAGGTFWLSETPDVPGSKGWDGACVRIATWCRFRLLSTSQQFYYVNTHLDSQGPIARFEGAKLVWHEMQEIMEKEGLPAKTPFLMTGDFNTFRPSNVFQFLTADADGPRLQDSWAAAGHRIGNISCTFHEFLGPKYDTLPHPDWHDPSMDPLNRVGTNHIDFILSRPPLPTLVTEVITEAWNGRYPSDHYPVAATLLFPSAVELPPPTLE